MFWKSEKFKLVPVISLFLVAGFLITSLASYFVSRASLRSEISDNTLPLTGDNIYSEIQRDLLRPVFISSLMASDTFLRDWVINGEKDVEPIIKYLNEIKTKYNTFTSFFVSDATRKYYHADGILKKVSPEEERDIWYFRVRKMKDDYEINVDPDLANKDAMTIFINYRVFDYQGNYIGATGVGLTVSAVKKLIELYQEKYNRNIFFVNDSGEITLSGSHLQSGLTNIAQMESPELLAEKLKLKSESSFSYKKNGLTTHTNIRYIKEFGWHLVVEQAEDDLIKKIFTTLIVNLSVCAVITIIVLMLVKATVRSYEKRIDTLRGIVPICSFCKQIRDDKGYWNQVEAYVAKYTDAQFSHSICPTCMEENYPEELNIINKKKKENAST